VTPPVIQRWIDVVDGGRFDELDDLLAEDAIFYSPAVFTPQDGRATAAAYLAAAGKLLGGAGFEYVGKWYAGNSAVLEFVAEIDGIHVNGVDMIHWNDDGQITSFKVMLRPMKALQAVIPEMSKLLQQSL
jgi:SnoaL-like domain